MHKLLLSFFIFLSSCQSNPPPKPSPESRVISIALNTDPGNIDPRKVGSIEGATLSSLLFEGLFRIGKDGSPEPSLAESFSYSKDGKIFEVHLRNSVWSNGDPVTAHDFEATIKQQLAADFPSPGAELLYVIQNARQAKENLCAPSEIGVTALSANRLKIELVAPSPTLPELLTSPAFLPVHKSLREDPQAPLISNGPFLLKEWQVEYAFEFQRNPRYWDAINFSWSQNNLRLVVGAEESALDLFQTHKLNWIGSPLSRLPQDAIPQLIGDQHLHTSPAAATQLIRINTTHEALANGLFRRALSLAVDRTNIVEHIFHHTQTPAYQLTPPQRGAEGISLEKEERIPLANRLFEEALQDLQLDRESLPPITLVYGKDDLTHKLAQELQSEWRRTLGISIQLQHVERKVLFQKRREMDYDLMMGNWFADINDPSNFLEVFEREDSSSNKTGWQSPLYTQLLEKAREELHSSKRSSLLSQAEKILIRECPIIPLFHYNFLSMDDGKLKDVVIAPTGRLELRHSKVRG